MYLEFCSCITTNLYFKIFVAGIFGIALTFVDDIDVLHSKTAILSILMVLILMTYTHLEEFGTVLLLLSLFVILQNIHATQDAQKKPPLTVNSA